jgi:hypothetical protein
MQLVDPTRLECATFAFENIAKNTRLFSPRQLRNGGARIVPPTMWRDVGDFGSVRSLSLCAA